VVGGVVGADQDLRPPNGDLEQQAPVAPEETRPLHHYTGAEAQNGDEDCDTRTHDTRYRTHATPRNARVVEAGGRNLGG
jgi:hypothetical protein